MEKKGQDVGPKGRKRTPPKIMKGEKNENRSERKDG